MSVEWRTFVADFETTVYKGQVHTEVWAAAIVELFSEDVHVFHSIDELYEYMKSLKTNIRCYFHNLKFDGTFWLDFLLNTLEYKQAAREWVDKNNVPHVNWIKERHMTSKTFQYSISEMGQWYIIKIKEGRNTIELRDSLKLLPFSVKKIGKSFGTKHKKLEMEYEGIRYAGCVITPEEEQYIKNDVLVVKEAIEIMYNEGHDKLTIGSCCLDEYKKTVGRFDYRLYFPNVYDFELDPAVYGYPNAGEYIRRSYKGGWCYVVEGKEKKIKHNGTTADVNSLYPSMMHSESGNYYPVGLPHFWSGNYIPSEAQQYARYFFIRIRTRFYLKRGKLPFIQMKNTLRYQQNECLKTSDIYYNGEYHNSYIDYNGEVKSATVELTLTMTDYKLIQEHYNLIDCEILDGCWFEAEKGIFDKYINHYKEIKMNSKGAIRELAKLFLNNLYGKMASNTNSSFKYAYIKEDKSIGFMTIQEQEKKPGYIPIGSAITSYARNFTIRAAQANYHGVSKPGFIYADTDSIHCDLPPEQISGITVHPTNFCCWKLESQWDTGIFVRQKTYIEHITIEDGEPCQPYYNVKCAGMPEKCKNLFIESMNLSPEKIKELAAKEDKTPEDLFLLEGKKTLKDFDVGLKVPGKLIPKRIRGGTVLQETEYTMR